MRLLPVGIQEHSDWEDGLWVEKPGFPYVDCSWIHPPPAGHSLPEFEFEEGHDKNKNEPAPVFYIGSGNDCHIRVDDDHLPEQICRVFKEGRTWFLEALLPGGNVHHGSCAVEVGQRMPLKDGQMFTLVRPPTVLAYRIHVSDDDNWYIDLQSDKDFPNKYPGRFPYRSSLSEAPQAPEELKRLAWQTDQMRRRSEEDQVRVGDWSAFSQYVKRHYYKYGIECVPWASEGRQRPIDKTPPPLQPRPYPPWIGELLAKERQQPGIDASRVQSFTSCMRASGVPMPLPTQFKGNPPRPEHLYENSSLSGPAVASASNTEHNIKLRPGPNSSGSIQGDQCTLATMDAGGNLTAPGTRQDAKLTELPVVNHHLKQSFREWLEGMDDSMFLMQYHDQIAANFDSLEQIHEIYFKHGELNKTFFEDTGIKKLGHRRIFEKWFKDCCR